MGADDLFHDVDALVGLRRGLVEATGEDPTDDEDPRDDGSCNDGPRHFDVPAVEMRRS